MNRKQRARKWLEENSLEAKQKKLYEGAIPPSFNLNDFDNEQTRKRLNQLYRMTNGQVGKKAGTNIDTGQGSTGAQGTTGYIHLNTKTTGTYAGVNPTRNDIVVPKSVEVPINTDPLPYWDNGPERKLTAEEVDEAKHRAHLSMSLKAKTKEEKMSKIIEDVRNPWMDYEEAKQKFNALFDDDTIL